MAIERLKSKVKEALMRYLLMKLFSQNLEILAPQNWVKKTQICISNTTGGKNIKIRNYNNFGWKSFFWYRNFKILKHRPLLWLHYWKTGTVRTELTPEICFSTSWNCKRFWSLIELVTLQKSYFQVTCFYRTPLVAHCKRSSLLQ